MCDRLAGRSSFHHLGCAERNQSLKIELAQLTITQFRKQQVWAIASQKQRRRGTGSIDAKDGLGGRGPAKTMSALSSATFSNTLPAAADFECAASRLVSGQSLCKAELQPASSPHARLDPGPESRLPVHIRPWQRKGKCARGWRLTLMIALSPTLHVCIMC